jgi:hypothetical protein
VIDNLWEAWPQAPDWSGTRIGGSVTAGLLQADSATPYWAADPAASFWSPLSVNFWPANVWAQLVYTFTVQPTSAGRLMLDATTSGDSTRLELQRGDQSSFWGPISGAAFWQAAAAPFWPPFTPNWQSWLGGLDVFATEQITFRATVSGGANRGSITTLTAKMDVPDITEQVAGMAVSAFGLRIPLAKKYRVIKVINCSVSVDGGTGVSVRVADKDPVLGPLIYVVDGTGTAVSGTVDANIEGY